LNDRHSLEIGAPVAALRERSSILIVDDQPANVRLLAQALGDGYHVSFAKTGVRALEIAARGGIDLVLLDVMLPDLDGFEVCRRLRNAEPTRDVPVIFVTSLEEVADEARGFEVGGVDYITKPISPPIVRARVRTHLELKAARDLLEELASVDALTGIANRRRFDQALQLEWRRAVRDRSRLGLALLDVDHFKHFNDCYGHTLGDHCLRRVAQELASTWRRPGDVVARYGGEEFAALLPATDAAGLETSIRQALARIRALLIPHERSSCAGVVTASGGAVIVQPRQEVDPITMVEAADRLLYQAKEAGRATVVLLDLDDGSRQRLQPQVAELDDPASRPRVDSELPEPAAG
jgi:diguanylate cyclase (GGDEF)-like protein